MPNPVDQRPPANPEPRIDIGALMDEFLNNPDVELEFIQRKAPLPAFQIIWGGADVDPIHYNLPRSKKCGRPDTGKDAADMATIQRMMENRIPIIGICRGAQILNVMNGGILVQHIDGHTHDHHILLDHKKYQPNSIVVQVTSTHHQMMIPHKSAEIIGRDHHPTTGVHWDNVDTPQRYKHVNEVIYYPATRSLCIQPHPEWMDQDSPFVNWINDFIEREWGLPRINFANEEKKGGFF